MADSPDQSEGAAQETGPAEPTAPARSDEAVISPAPPHIVAEERREMASAESEQKGSLAAPAPVVAAAPPPPPPPAPEALRDENVVVTGSRIPAPKLSKQEIARVAENAAEPASPFAMIDPYGELLSRLQAALRANDRRAVIRLIGFPLRVTLDGEARTYRSPREVGRDFDRIFTPQVRLAVLNQRPDALVSRGAGRLVGDGRLWLGPSSGRSIRIREVNP